MRFLFTEMNLIILFTIPSGLMMQWSFLFSLFTFLSVSVFMIWTNESLAPLFSADIFITHFFLHTVELTKAIFPFRLDMVFSFTPFMVESVLLFSFQYIERKNY